MFLTSRKRYVEEVWKGVTFLIVKNWVSKKVEANVQRSDVIKVP